jgi:ribosomal protein S18 acetylase RimI-like enzyme
MTSLRFRAADPGDAGAVARLHADSWRRHYRGAYADAFLDGDVVANRSQVWSARLAAAGAACATVVAEEGSRLVGFVHVVLDDDPHWGSLVDNLHVAHDRQRTGIGAALLARAGEAVAGRATMMPVYLWVLEQNTSAQRFYRSLGGSYAGREAVSPPGGVPAWLDGSPAKFRFTWPDAGSLTRAAARCAAPSATSGGLGAHSV